MLSPTLFYFLKVVPGEFACFRGGVFAKQNGGNFHGIDKTRNREKVSERGGII